MTAQESTDRLHDLLMSGFRVDDVSSTSKQVIVELVKDQQAITLRFGEEAARALLKIEEAKTAKRVPASMS